MQNTMCLQNTHIEGLEALMSRFGNILEEVRRKPYDLLDASKTIFERDFLEFNVHISDLEASVQAQTSLSLLLEALRHEAFLIVYDMMPCLHVLAPASVMTAGMLCSHLREACDVEELIPDQGLEGMIYSMDFLQ